MLHSTIGQLRVEVGSFDLQIPRYSQFEVAMENLILSYFGSWSSIPKLARDIHTKISNASLLQKSVDRIFHIFGFQSIRHHTKLRNDCRDLCFHHCACCLHCYQIWALQKQNLEIPLFVPFAEHPTSFCAHDEHCSDDPRSWSHECAVGSHPTRGRPWPQTISL